MYEIARESLTLLDSKQRTASQPGLGHNGKTRPRPHPFPTPFVSLLILTAALDVQTAHAQIYTPPPADPASRLAACFHEVKREHDEIQTELNKDQQKFLDRAEADETALLNVFVEGSEAVGDVSLAASAVSATAAAILAAGTPVSGPAAPVTATAAAGAYGAMLQFAKTAVIAYGVSWVSEMIIETAYTKIRRDIKSRYYSARDTNYRNAKEEEQDCKARHGDSRDEGDDETGGNDGGADGAELDIAEPDIDVDEINDLAHRINSRRTGTVTVHHVGDGGSGWFGTACGSTENADGSIEVDCGD